MGQQQSCESQAVTLPIVMCFSVSHTFTNVTGEENRPGWQLMVMLCCCLLTTGLWQHCVCGCVWISSARPPTVQSFYPPVFPSDFSTSQYIFSAVHGTEMLLDVSNTLLFSTSHWREPQLPFKYRPSYALPHCLLSYSSSFLSRLNELNWTETVLLYHWT